LFVNVCRIRLPSWYLPMFATSTIGPDPQMGLFLALCLIGAFFGVCCHYLVLVPLTLATLIACGAYAASYGLTGFETVITMIVSAVALQGGYVAGLTSRELLVPSKRIRLE